MLKRSTRTFAIPISKNVMSKVRTKPSLFCKNEIPSHVTQIP